MAGSGDILNILYQELFYIKFLHGGYSTSPSNSISSNIRLLPDENTRKLFEGYNIGYKFINDTLICYVRSKLFAAPARDPKVPYVLLAGDVRIRFLMFTTSTFIHKTYVVSTGKEMIYRFSNRIDNVIDSDRFISKPLAAYAASADYDAGTVVQQGSQLFVSIKPLRGAENIQISNINYWQVITPVEQLVNNADLENLSTSEVEENCFAVIDIYNNGTTNSSYDLFAPGVEQHISGPVYTIRFKSKI